MYINEENANTFKGYVCKQFDNIILSKIDTKQLKRDL